MSKLLPRRVVDALMSIARWGIAAVFLFSSIPKLQRPHVFLSNVYDYELVSPRLALLVAAALPAVELLLGACLALGIFLGGATLMSAGLLALFSGAQASALARGLVIGCGCFGGAEPEEVSYFTLLRTLLLFSISIGLFVYLYMRPRNESSNPIPLEA